MNNRVNNRVNYPVNQMTLVSKTARNMQLVLGLVALMSTSQAFGEQALFSKGAETFNIENKSGQTPTFRVLSGSMTKQALAMAAASLLNAEDDVKPKIPLNPYFDLKFQTLTLTPLKDERLKKDQLRMTLKLSGYAVDLDQTISRTDLLLGKVIDVIYPKTEKDVAMYSVESSGRMKLHLEKPSQSLILENVEAKMSFSSAIGEDGKESVQFSGKARRQM